MKSVNVISLLIFLSACGSNEPKNSADSGTAIKTEQPVKEIKSNGSFAISVMEGDKELMKLSGNGAKAADDGKVMRIYMDDKNNGSSITMETGNVTSGEYTIGVSTEQKTYASMMIIPGENMKFEWPTHLRTGSISLTVSGNSLSGTVQGSGEAGNTKYTLKGNFESLPVEKIKVEY